SVSDKKMEFWPENQGQSPLYSKFGTVPGRNCTHNYHERHQATHYPLYYGEQQDQSRESSYWTVPGSRTGGAPQEYTNWMDQDPRASHFPFILDRHPQQHQDLGEYQPHEARDREWTAAQRAAREYERGFLREGWQRRWEPCSPVRYSREVSTKRSDSSYRELEAWAARYSHSLPRRRRIEAELRGASQGVLDSSRAPERDSRSGTDPRVAALQHVLQSANIRESGLWDRGGRQPAPTYYPSQTPAADMSHMLHMKEKSNYERRTFSQPPGYIAPPPYNSPHKSSPVLHHFDTSWEQEGKRQIYCSQPPLRKQDVSVDVQDYRKEKEDLTKPDGNQNTFPELEGLKHRRQETDSLQTSSPNNIQQTHIPCGDMLSLQQPQVLQAVLDKKRNEEPSSKVIEGRKFRLNKKTGGMTIFCLVSRIAGATDSPSLPLCASHINIQSTELEGSYKGLSKSSDITQTHNFPDEVDFKAQTLTEQSKISDVKNLKSQKEEMPTFAESEMLEDNPSNEAERDVVASEKASDADHTFGRQVGQSVQPASVKYPLWREPSFTSRAETESLSTHLKGNSEEGESDIVHNQEDSSRGHPIDVEVRRLDIMKDTESEDSKDLLVIDTTCVVVKMELIPSPKKDHVHYLGCTTQPEHSPIDIQSTITSECAQSNSQLNQDTTNDQKADTNPADINEKPETEEDSDLMEKQASREESEISLLCMSSSPVSEKETLEERAERILGIPLHDYITEQQSEEDAMSLLGLCVEDKEVEPSQIKDNVSDNDVEQLPGGTIEEEQPQNQLGVGQTKDAECLQEDDDTSDQVANEGLEDFVGPQEQVSYMFEENDIVSQLKTDIKTTEDPLFKSTSEEGTTEQSQEENKPAENDISSQHPPQCLSPPTNLSNSSLPLPLSLDSEATRPALSLKLPSSDLTSLLCISESNMEEGPDSVLNALNSAENLAPYPETTSLPHTPSQQLPSPLPPGSTDISPSSTPHRDHSETPSVFDLIDQTAEEVSGDVEEQDEEGKTINSEISQPLKELAKNTTEDLVSEQQFESVQPDNAACVKESNITDEQLTKEVDHAYHIMEQTLQISQENAKEDNILQQQLECEENLTDSHTQSEVNILQQQFHNGQEEGDSCLKQSYVTEEEKEANEDPSKLIMEETFKISQENAKEVNTLQQQLECEQVKDIDFMTKSYLTEDELPKETDKDPTGLLKQTTSQENATDSQSEVNILPQQFDNGQEEDDSCLRESYVTEEQTQKEASEDPLDHIMEETSEYQISEENAKEVNTVQQQPECIQAEDVACLKESYMTKEQLQKEADEDPTGLLKQTISKTIATDFQTTIEIKTVQDTEPQSELSKSSSPMQSDLDCEVCQSHLVVFSPSELPAPQDASHKSDTESVFLLEIHSVCPSDLNPDSDVAPVATTAETVPPPLHLDSCENSLQFASFSSSDSPRVLLPSSSAFHLQEESASVSLDLPLKEEPQYPSSLWDAVNRIRKHTAPDSENEEEEMSELWDPENVGDVFNEAGQQEVLTEGRGEDVEVGQLQQDLRHKEQSGHAEEDTMSCSSTSSHGSGDTVIVADDEVEEMPPDTGTENKTEIAVAKGEQCRSGEVKDETAAEGEEDNDRDEHVTNEPTQSEECLVQMVNITMKSLEVMEIEQKENEEEYIFMVSEVSDEEMNGRDS
ncbi:hypothetical protein L3Q82_025007, partial [Scortum barcoo]